MLCDNRLILESIFHTEKQSPLRKRHEGTEVFSHGSHGIHTEFTE